MRLRFAALLAVALGFNACATMPRATNTTTDAILRNEPDQLIVITVENSAETLATRAGSTPRGYDSNVSYHASRAARETIAAIEHEYGLHQVVAWPIDALNVHCVVFRVPTKEERTALLDKLQKDARVRIAQPLQVFATSR